MTSKFVWITDDYRVNVDSIFSLQRIKKDETDDHAIWQDKHDIMIANIEDEYKDILTDETKSEKEKTDQIVKDICEDLGPEPEKWEYEYVVITQTGLKITITKDKYDLLNHTIDDIYLNK